MPKVLQFGAITFTNMNKNYNKGKKFSGGGSLPLILMHAHALKTYLSGGYLPCSKDYKVWYFSK